MKKKGTPTALLVLGMFLAGLIGSGVSLKTDADSLWEQNLKVVYGEVDGCWFLKGHRAETWSNEWTRTANNLWTAVNDQNKFEDVFVGMMGNPYNNTIFVVLTEIEKDTTDEIIRIMNPQKNETIRFLEGPASRKQLKQWCSKLDFSELVEEIGLTGSVITPNGTILLWVEKVTPEVVMKLSQYTEELVPHGVLVLAECPRLTDLEEQTDRIRPIEAGIRVTSEKNSTHHSRSTLNFLVTEEGESDELALVIGHAVSGVNADVWQNESGANNKIGDVSQDPDGPRFSDCALVPLDNGVTAISEIWMGAYDVNVVGQVNSSGLTIGQAIEMTGVASGYQWGELDFKDVNLTSTKYSDLYFQLKVDMDCSKGDSGAPAYNYFYEGGSYNANAIGIVVGEAGGHTVISPVNGIEDDLGKDLDFTGAG